MTPIGGDLAISRSPPKEMSFAMWQVLFYTNPTTIGVSVAVLSGAALVISFLRRDSPETFARRSQVLLGVACVGYLIILVPPIFGATGIGATEREVIWNPLNSFKEEDNTLEGSYIGQPGDESYIYYEAQELSEEEVEHAREEASPDDAAYYRYPVIGGGAVWFDSEGHDLDAEMRANLE